MDYLQAIFTTLWTTWNHRNRVVHEGINPNPMDVILAAQSLSCRYKESFNDQPTYNSSPGRPKAEQQPAAGQWQLIIKIAGARCKKPKSQVNMWGNV